MSAPEIINPGAASGGIPVGGSGTPGKIAKFTGTGTSIGDSLLSESGTTITSAATAETFTNNQAWTIPVTTVGLAINGSKFVFDGNGLLGINIPSTPSTCLHVADGAGTGFAGSVYEGVRLQRATEALFSSSDGTRSFRAGLTGSTAVVGTSTAHDLLLQRGNVTALTLGASGAVTFAGNLTSSAAQTWTLAAGSTSALNIASNLLNLDTTNSRVGIGTASPQEKLQVYGDLKVGVLASGSYISLGDEATTNRLIGIFRAPGDTLLGVGGYAGIKFTVGAASLGSQTERMRIDATGNVGIGTTAPSGPLSVTPLQYSTGTASQALLVVTGVGTTFTAAMVGSQLVFASGVSAGTITAFTDATTITVSVSQTVTSQAYKISYTGLQVSTGGSVGIGMTSPLSGHSLSVNGKIGGSLFTGSYVEFPVSGNTSLRANYTVNIGYADTLNVTNGGLVGIGTASPGRKLVVNDAAAETFLSIRGLVGGSSGLLMGDTTTEVLGVVRVFTSGPGIYLGAGNNQHLSINATGNVGIGTASPTGRLHVVGGTAAASTAGTPVTIIAQSGGTGNTNGGSIVLTPGTQSGTGTVGLVDLSGPTGTGLKLPAVPGNADAQTLDCYQENPLATTAGNGWTPTLSAAATWGGTQPNVTYARYVRMGSMVFCEVKLTMGTGTMTSTYPLTTIDSPVATNTNANHSAVPVAAPGASGVGFQTGTTVYLPPIGASSTFILSWSFFA